MTNAAGPFSPDPGSPGWTAAGPLISDTHGARAGGGFLSFASDDP